MPGAATIIIQTRWNENDLSGGILPVDWDGESGFIRGRDGLEWYVLCLPGHGRPAKQPAARRAEQQAGPGTNSGYRPNAVCRLV